MTYKDKDLERRVAELQKEAFSKNFTEKVLVIMEGHPAHKWVEGGYWLLKHDSGMVLEQQPSKYYENHSGATRDFNVVEVTYKGKSAYRGLYPQRTHLDEFESKLYSYVNYNGRYEDFHKACLEKLHPHHIQRYLAGDWEQVLNKLYERVIKIIDKNKVERKLEEEKEKSEKEEQRMKDLREDFGIEDLNVNEATSRLADLRSNFTGVEANKQSRLPREEI